MKTMLFLIAAATATAVHAAPPAKPAPAGTLMCKDGSFGTAKAGCRGRGGVFASTATKTVTAPAEGVSAASVTTKLPTSSAAKSTAVTVNNADERATTKLTQTTTPGSARLLVSTKGSVTTAFCVDGTSMKVRALTGACRGHGGLRSSQTTAAMRVPAGGERSIATKSGAGVAVATTANPEDAASATRVTQTTVYTTGFSAVCKDGTKTTNKSRQPCLNRGGVKRWL